MLTLDLVIFFSTFLHNYIINDIDFFGVYLNSEYDINWLS